jgi:hypothetical protein
LWHVADNLDEAVHLIDLDDVDQFLLEVLPQAHVNFVAELGVLVGDLLQVGGQGMYQFLGANVLHWDLNGLLAEAVNCDQTVENADRDIRAPEQVAQITLEIDDGAEPLAELAEVALPETGSCRELGEQVVVVALPFVALDQVLDSDAPSGVVKASQVALESLVEVILGDVRVVE